jgi:SAM-dependent methyltransferase
MSKSKKESEEAYRFAENGDSHDLPAIAAWFFKHIHEPNLVLNTGATSFQDLVIEEVKALRLRNQGIVLVSVGAGHGQIESELFRRIQKETPGGTELYSLDLFSPNDITEIELDGNAYRLRRASFDANSDSIPRDANIVIVHHALHHFTALEQIFENIHEILRINSGTLVIADMVGRNGHMRWPESLHAIRKIWRGLPLEKRTNNQLNQTWSEFENWDCSSEGFEGIRSEDILKSLFKFFEINKSYFWGGIIDPFIDRGFGGNFDPTNEADVETILKISAIESKLTELGILTPTQVIGSFKPRWIPTVDSVTNFFCSKKISSSISNEIASLIDTVVDENFGIQKHEICTIQKNTSYENKEISRFNQYGWEYSDSEICWGFGLESKIAFWLYGETLSQIKIQSVVLSTSLNGRISVTINNEIEITQAFLGNTVIQLPKVEIFELDIRVNFSRIAKVDDDLDKRLITFYIQNLEVE